LESAGNASSDYPAQDVWWLRYRVLMSNPQYTTGQAPDAEAWACLYRARETMLAGIASVSDEELRYSYLNRVEVNRAILAEWSHHAGRVVKEPHSSQGQPFSERSHSGSQLKRILDISLKMNETRDTNELLRYVLDQVLELSGAERGFLTLVE